MVRIIMSEWHGYGVDKNYIEAAGLSTDSKPTDDLLTGSLFLEVDTGNAYAFDEVSGTWNKIGG